MSAISWLLWGLTVVAPAAAWLAVLRRERPARTQFSVGLFAALLGAVAFVPAVLLEEILLRWAGLDRYARTADVATLVYALLVAAPLEQGLKVAAVAPLVRTRKVVEPIDGVVYASTAALGFVTVHNAVYLWGRALPSVDIARALLALPAHVAFATAWGFTLGRDRRRRIGGRWFNVAWLGAALFNGVFDHLVFARRPVAMLAALPILLCAGVIALVAVQSLLRQGEAISDARVSRLLTSMTPPSIGAVREALRRTERPVTLRWIVFGALVTTGVLTACLAGAVALGHRVGIDFAAVDRAEAQVAAMVPLVFIGGAAMSAFPIAGYLVARASATRSVLEPAISAALAIVGSLVLLGLAAPVAVVFAIAFAPVAFGLACVGSWMGMSR
ncbi:PrsW family glutamic-type intramembrane protease [Chondromyces crocatus]|uniref:PrsW family intramembrane metalloprotease n=1 Tax=Chondromyces crocatus TaxID=52 RepID=A0A0K1ENW0_CHOCO|nr:PrsW family glutamic-type intramembrane protease [Chondromyces crocatus]AKT42308.1 uncharacterized protein CMC5_065310 [Chondromyces crocatus]